MRTVPRIIFELLAPSTLGGIIFAGLMVVGAHSLGGFLLGVGAAVLLAMRACLIQSICCTVLIELAYWRGLKPGSPASVAAYVGLAALSSGSLILISEPDDWTLALVFVAIGGAAGLFVGLVVRCCQRRADAKLLNAAMESTPAVS